MLKWLNAFSFCLWKHENKSWIRGPYETELILILILYLNIYKSARKWNRRNKVYPKAVLASKLQRQDQPFDFPCIIFHLSLKGPSPFCILSYYLWKAQLTGALRKHFISPSHDEMRWGNEFLHSHHMRIIFGAKQNVFPMCCGGILSSGCYPTLFHVSFLPSVCETKFWAHMNAESSSVHPSVTLTSLNHHLSKIWNQNLSK